MSDETHDNILDGVSGCPWRPVESVRDDGVVGGLVALYSLAALIGTLAAAWT